MVVVDCHLFTVTHPYYCPCLRDIMEDVGLLDFVLCYYERAIHAYPIRWVGV